jgi:hypothetical protein
MRAAVLFPVVALAMGCGEHNPSSTIDKVTVTAATPDAGAGESTGSGSGTPMIPTAGTQDDVLSRVFDLGTEPSVPGDFGSLRPGMTRKDAKKARPKAWGEAWSAPVASETDVTLQAGLPDASDDPIQRLTVVLEQRDAVARLQLVWGAPALTAFSKSTVCWLAPASKLKACHTKDLERDEIQLTTYTPLVESLASGTVHTPVSAYTRLGKSKAEVMRAFPGAVEYNDPEDPTQHRLEILFPTNEFTADVAPDRSVYYLDKADKVLAIHLWYGSNDPALRAEVIAALDGAVKQVKPDADTLVAVRDQDPSAVVVVLDRTPGLR